MSLNKVLLIGRLGFEPEVRYQPDGGAVATLRLATNEVWKDKSGNKQERTEWHRVVLWGRLAEIAGQYLKKGSQVYVEGRIQTRKWTDQSGQEKYTTEIVASEMKMLDSKGSSPSGMSDFDAPPPAYSGGAPTPAPRRAPAPAPTPAANPNWDDLGDDIPF